MAAKPAHESLIGDLFGGPGGSQSRVDDERARFSSAFWLESFGHGQVSGVVGL
jgi:hypothetical protein